MVKYLHTFGDKRRVYRERLEAKIAFHAEFHEEISAEELKEIKVIVRLEIEKEYKHQMQRRFVFSILGFLSLAFVLYFVLHELSN